MTAYQLAKKPGGPSAEKLKKPPTICWLTDAMMNSPTPEPTPHLLTISSMNRMRMPPTKICAKISSWTPNMPIPSELATALSAGRNPPVNTIGAAVSADTMITSSFWRP
jgi:hypothetical protein